MKTGEAPGCSAPAGSPPDDGSGGRRYDLVILGATGAVGGALLDILAERAFPVNNLYALASERSAGQTLGWSGRRLVVQDAAGFDFSQAQIGLFSAGAANSGVYAPRAVAAGCLVIDNSSKFRYQDEIPLVVPEVNGQVLGPEHRLIGNPNCSTIQMLLALAPIHAAVGIERINVATYQAVSGAGMAAERELSEQTAEVLAGRDAVPRVLPGQIAFNVLPWIGPEWGDGHSWEEMKMLWETRKILGDPDIRMNATCVRVPVFRGHSEAINIETRERITAQQARELLAAAPGLEVFEDPGDGVFPTPARQGSGTDAVFVGRIREDLSHPRGLNLWVVADNVRKGAALNSVQIAEQIVARDLIQGARQPV